MTVMWSAVSARDFAAIWDISTPSRPGRLPGVSMAGFRSRTAEPVDIRIVPYPAVTLFIEFGGDGMVVDDDGGRQHRGNSVVVGLAPGNIRGSGRDIECLQVRLSPAAAYPLFGAPGLLGEAVVALDDLWGHDAQYIHERLCDATSWDERFAIAEATLARRLEMGRVIDREISFAWDQMANRRGRLRVDQLARTIGWSRKRLWSRFQSQVGITPKRAVQLVRFDRAAHRLAAGQSIARVALDSGYVDQSHLNRDVMAFARMTPTAVALAPWLAVDDIAWPTRGHRFDRTSTTIAGSCST
jgi:AraC-like DNA-binding protein